ncbi:MAG: bifunctional (p)ppGpp synthetase/guanosine-3',5'-bis(diphosphate) 3'-pyrophosphohydrolase, partial [Rhodoblastus sp.]|nr:bifunctional (p)ppGpp synthetase/guanosine-3',5'-bis(diphosphate) 3'-pyrophosphohydrolase [Rhodoblastus sp.]
ALARTGKARSAIRRATKDAARAQYAGLGRQIVTRAFERAGKPFTDDALKAVLSRLARPNVDDVFVAVGRGEMFSGDVVKALHPEFKEERKVAPAVDKKESGWFNFKNVSKLMFRAPGGDPSKAVPIRGLRGDLPVRFAPNGGAVPGDRIVGIVSPGEGITIYPIQSPALSAFDNEPERWIDVRWDLEEFGRDKFPAQIKVTAINEPGSLGAIANVIGDAGANIANVAFQEHSPDFRDVLLDVEVNDLKHLTGIMSQLKAKPVVSKVERING